MTDLGDDWESFGSDSSSEDEFQEASDQVKVAKKPARKVTKQATGTAEVC